MTTFHYFHQCISCGEKFSPDGFLYTCPDCGGLLMVERDLSAIEKSFEKQSRL